MKRVKIDTEYIIEVTSDRTGWVAGYADGTLFIAWDNQRFMSTLSIMIELVPQVDEQQVDHLNKMEKLVEWLSEYHFDKMHKEII